jgi:hypothetical protein
MSKIAACRRPSRSWFGHSQTSSIYIFFSSRLHRGALARRESCMLESLSRRLAVFIFLLILLLLTSSFCFFLRFPVVVLGSQLPYHPQPRPLSLSLSFCVCAVQDSLRLLSQIFLICMFHLRLNKSLAGVRTVALSLKRLPKKSLKFCIVTYYI